MELDPVFLSRLQFGLTVGFHYLFPPLTIGLGLLMVFMEAAYVRTKNRQYEAMAKFWTKLFALIFAMGVATGIVMEFQFGTNWATYSRYVGDIFGSALAAEGVFAFFLESGFLAVLVFGWDKVSPRMHFFSTCMVSLGSMFSAVWIVVANSWQQTPGVIGQTYHIVGEGVMQRAEVLDFWAVVFNPSTVDRLAHTLVGAFIAGSFFVLSVSSYYLLKKRHEDFAKKSIAIALPFATVFCLAALVTGHSNAKMVADNQPPKLAAFEGVYHTRQEATPLYLWGLPDDESKTVKYGVAIPGLLSYLVYGDWTTPIKGLDAVKPEDWPPVGPSFQTYHAMVAIGMAMIGLTLFAGVLLWRGILFRQRWLLRIFVFAITLPLAANQLGWLAAEIGRQPWIVYGLLRTKDAASKSVDGIEVLISIIMFGLIYLLLLLVWLFVMDHKIRVGPENPEDLAREAEKRGWVAIATARTGKSESMTEAEQDDPAKEGA